MAHVMAHEIGHLLLGRDSHGRSGLMSADWSKAEQSQLIRGVLHSTDEERVMLRAAVAARGSD